MQINEYQEKALRTANKKCGDLCNIGLGLTGEAGEAADIIKKHIFHGHELDEKHLAEELGDVAWYLAVGAHLIGYSLEEIFQMNILKLLSRYPDGFTEEDSIDRKDGGI